MVFTDYGSLPQLKIDGVNVEDWKLCIVDRPRIPTPQPKLTTYQIDGAFNGDIYTATGWDNVEINVTFNFLEDLTTTIKSFREYFSEVRSNIMNAKQIVFNDAPKYIHNVKVVNIQESTNDILEYGMFTVSFTCDPFATIDEPALELTTGSRTLKTLHSGFQTTFPTFEVSDISKNTASERAISMYMRRVNNGTSTPYWQAQLSSVPNQSPAIDKLIIDGTRRVVYYVDLNGGITYPKNELKMDSFPYIEYPYDPSLGRFTSAFLGEIKLKIYKNGRV